MKITLLHYAAHPIVGGVENVMHQHSLLMADAGHRVTVIAGRGERHRSTSGLRPASTRGFTRSGHTCSKARTRRRTNPGRLLEVVHAHRRSAQGALQGYGLGSGAQRVLVEQEPPIDRGSETNSRIRRRPSTWSLASRSCLDDAALQSGVAQRRIRGTCSGRTGRTLCRSRYPGIEHSS